MPYCNSSHRNDNRHGFTLIEVLAGLVLLGSLLVTVTLAKSRYTRQLALAQRQLEAVEIADSTLSQWWQESPDSIPRNGKGLAKTGTGGRALSWRTRQLDMQENEQTGFTIVRFELYDPKQTESQSSLVAVDLVIADPIEEETEPESIQPTGGIDSTMDQTDEG